MNERPFGALSELKDVPIYGVSKNDGYLFRAHKDEIRTAINQRLIEKWFGELGYLFDNYFHALAFSLKAKAEYDKQKGHSPLP
jgi:hypothetical protein